MKVPDFAEIRRKLETSGLNATLETGWEELYTNRILKQYFKQLILSDKSTTPIYRRDLSKSADDEWDVDGVSLESPSVPNRAAIPTIRSVRTVQHREPAETSIFKFSPAYVLGPSGLAVNQNGRLITSSVGSPPEEINRARTALAKLASANGFLWTRRWIQKTPVSESRSHASFETAATIVPLWKNYYHWLVECLPRLRSIAYYARREDVEPTILVPAERPEWMNEWLDALDIPGAYEELSHGFVKADNLLIPSHPDPNANDCKWLREQLLASGEKRRGDRRIVISRSDANSRRISNKKDIQPVLSEFGFQEVVLSDLSIHEQAKLAAEAEIIVSPHGAGLANIVFATDAVVVELFGSKKYTSYRRIAKINGLDYRSISGYSEGPDIAIDPDELQQILSIYLDS